MPRLGPFGPNDEEAALAGIERENYLRASTTTGAHRAAAATPVAMQMAQTAATKLWYVYATLLA